MLIDDISALVDRLMDLSEAAQERLNAGAAMATSPRLRGELVLQAAEHDADALLFQDLVAELLGTPNDGDAAPVVSMNHAVDGMTTRALLEGCLEQEASLVAQWNDVLARSSLPAALRTALERCVARSRTREQRLRALLAENGKP
ncbi:MAG: hypothetical protein JSR59_08895 [Proteobacteria bacterium]|nr:hypothetical protein [Pseudomonadota bacterium]